MSELANLTPLGAMITGAVARPAASWFVNSALRWATDPMQPPNRRELEAAAEWFREFVESNSSLYQSAEPYLRSHEFMTVTRNVMLLRISGRPVDVNGPVLEQIRVGLALQGCSDNDDLAQSLLELLTGFANQLVSTCHLDTTQARDAVESQAHAVSVETHLASMDAQIRRLTEGRSRDDLRGLDQTLDRYSLVAMKKHGRIQPPDTDGSDHVPIDDLYVPPTVSLTEGDSDRRVAISAIHLLPRAVVLGDPGGGKTTLTKKIAHDLLVKREIEGDYPHPIPFVIVLRDFGAAIRQRALSVKEYISEQLRYAFQCDLSPASVEWALDTGRLYVIFDGLDELLQTESRRAIAEVIDSFATVYTSAMILVTSRRVGYRQAPLANDVFRVLELGEFENSQVELYVEKWFSAQPRLNSDQASAATAGFMRDSTLVEDLRRNPLMLALMCTIYRSESYIPRNRPDVYEKCSRMLFDRWDRHRGLFELLEFEAHIEPALMHIAIHLYEDQEAQAGVTEAQLVALAADYLDKWQFNNRAAAEHAARQFIAFCSGRAWVFSDVGLDELDAPLFQFTHRTFLEFFAASHLARTYVDIEALCDRLAPILEVSEWDVVGQLALQVKTKTVLGGPDAAVTLLLDRADQCEDRSARQNLIGFMSRCTAFLITSPEVSRRLVMSALRILVEEAAVASNDDWSGGEVSDSDVEVAFTACVAPLKRSAREVRSMLLAEVSRQARNLMESDRSRLAELGCAVAMSFVNDELPPEGSRVEELHKLATYLTERLRREEWTWGTVALFYVGDISMQELVDAVGHHATIVMTPIPGVSLRYYPPAAHIAARLLRRNCFSVVPTYLAPELAFDVSSYREAMTVAARHLLEDPPPESQQMVLPVVLPASEPTKDEVQHSSFGLETLTCALYILATALDIENGPSAATMLHDAEHLGHMADVRGLVGQDVPIDVDTPIVGRLRSWVAGTSRLCSVQGA